MLNTVSDLEDALWHELAWRKKELLQVSLQVKAAPGWAIGMQIRAGITLLYAHWEGFVKAAGERLVAFVRDQGHRNEELAAGYLTIAFGKELRQVQQSEKSSMPEIVLTRALIKRAPDQATFVPSGSVPTASNLSWKQFELVAARLEVRTAPFALLRQLIDVSLVGARNTIAHGDPTSPLDHTAYGVLHAKVLGLLDSFAREVIRAADERTYLR